MSHPYLCPSAWNSATVALQKAGFGGIIFGDGCAILPPRSWRRRHRKTQTGLRSGFRVYKGEEALICRLVLTRMRNKDKRKGIGEDWGVSNFCEYHFCAFFICHDCWREVARRESSSPKSGIYRERCERRIGEAVSKRKI